MFLCLFWLCFLSTLVITWLVVLARRLVTGSTSGVNLSDSGVRGTCCSSLSGLIVMLGGVSWWVTGELNKKLFLPWLQSTWKNINIVYHWLSPLSVLSLWSSVDLSCPADLSLCLRSLVCTRVLIPAGTCGGWTTALVSSDEESLLVLWPWLDPWDPPDDAWLPITDILRCWWYQLLVSAILSKLLSQTDDTGTCVLVFWS